MKAAGIMSYKLLFEVLTGLTAASWIRVASLGHCLADSNPQDECTESDIYLQALCFIHDNESFATRIRLLADLNVAAAMQLSMAGVHFSLCCQQVWMGKLDQAAHEAQAFIRHTIASAKRIGLEIHDEQKTIFLERASCLPARIQSQQSLTLARSRGRIPGRLLFVLGTHRSGTSALTGLLGKLGVDVPKDLMPPTVENPHGYWEPLGIVKENDQLLSILGTNWRMEESLPAGWPDLQPARKWRDNLLLALQESFGDSDFAVIKDPRFCTLITGLSQWIEEKSVDFQFALLIRNPLEVVSSLMARSRDPIPKEESFRLWIQCVIESERATRPYHRIIILADDLFESPQEVASELQQFIAVEPLANTLQGAAAFIDPTLRHHHGDKEKLSPPGLDTIHCEILQDLSIRIYNQIKNDRLALATEKLDELYSLSMDLIHQ